MPKNCAEIREKLRQLKKITPDKPTRKSLILEQELKKYCEKHNLTSETSKQLVRLANLDPEIRLSAIKYLGEIDREEIVLPLIKTLNDKNPIIKKFTIKTLGKIGNKQATKPLIQIMTKNKNIVVKCYAINALGKIRDKQATKPLIQMLKNENPLIKKFAKKALEKIGEIK